MGRSLLGYCALWGSIGPHNRLLELLESGDHSNSLYN